MFYLFLRVFHHTGSYTCGRLDAQYDWLPPFEILGNGSFQMATFGTGCDSLQLGVSQVLPKREAGRVRVAPWLKEAPWKPEVFAGPLTSVTGKIAVVTSGGCSYYTKVRVYVHAFVYMHAHAHACVCVVCFKIKRDCQTISEHDKNTIASHNENNRTGRGPFRQSSCCHPDNRKKGEK